jgi:thiol:disulfide interchange protein DsbA
VSVPAGRIEVTEAFSYGCIYCYRAKDQVRELEAALPPDAVMTYLHASFNPSEAWPMFQRAFYTAQALGIEKATHEQMFIAVWETGEVPLRDPQTGGIRRPLPTIEDAARFYEKYARVKRADFLALAASKQIDEAVKRADTLVELNKVPGTPALLVNGRYLINNENLGSWAEVQQLALYLIGLERRRLKLPTPAAR